MDYIDEMNREYGGNGLKRLSTCETAELGLLYSRVEREREVHKSGDILLGVYLAAPRGYEGVPFELRLKISGTVSKFTVVSGEFTLAYKGVTFLPMLALPMLSVRYDMTTIPDKFELYAIYACIKDIKDRRAMGDG